MITVMGATGHTGKKIADALLLQAGERIRALGRSASKLAELERAGAEVRTGDVADAAFLTQAFGGAEAVYTLLPTDRHARDYRAAQDRQGEAIVRAIRRSGVRYVVALSSLGADLHEGTGVIAGLRARRSASSARRSSASPWTASRRMSRTPGMRFVVRGPDGGERPVTVRGLSDDHATLDFNHPLAGERLSFSVEVVEVQAMEEESGPEAGRPAAPGLRRESR
ncbi:MAG: NAD(P)H-binding protein [Candidatus Methylomirabilales bacterium]